MWCDGRYVHTLSDLKTHSALPGGRSLRWCRRRGRREGRRLTSSYARNASVNCSLDSSKAPTSSSSSTINYKHVKFIESKRKQRKKKEDRPEYNAQPSSWHRSLDPSGTGRPGWLRGRVLKNWRAMYKKQCVQYVKHQKERKKSLLQIQNLKVRFVISTTPRILILRCCSWSSMYPPIGSIIKWRRGGM